MKTQNGFTLLDLLLSLAIFAITTGYAVPNLQEYLARSKADSTSIIIQRGIATARQYAISEEEIVTFCGLNAEGECANNAIDSLAIFIDKNNDKRVDGDDDLYFNPTLSYPGELRLSASLGREYIRFKPAGSSEQAGSFLYCYSKFPTHARRITISLTGRFYVGADSDGDGITELTNGRPIRC